jgi:hypothetical protein
VDGTKNLHATPPNTTKHCTPPNPEYISLYPNHSTTQ